MRRHRKSEHFEALLYVTANAFVAATILQRLWKHMTDSIKSRPGNTNGAADDAASGDAA